ncbi:MAG: TonB-dependent receptor plug domain-containing protein, partial [Pseudomonadota bacterium]
MLEQIPGFSIQQSDQNQRGFGQAQENVLINGQRISSKSTNAIEALSRIPVQNVEKIELLDGATLDIPGLNGQVANVTAKANGISGTWTYRHRYRENLAPALDWIELSVNGQSGALGWTLGLDTEPRRGTASGRENIFDGAGTLEEFRLESGRFLAEDAGLNAGLNWTPSNGHIANLNAEYRIWEPDELETSAVFEPDGTPRRETIFKATENEWNSEVSGDYELGLGPGRLKFIGLQRNEHSPTRSQFFGADLDGQNVTNRVFERVVDESESILRGEYSWSGANNTDWQISLEGALNTLDSEAQFSRSESLDFVTPVINDNPNIRVEEKRAEAFVTHGRSLGPDLRLQVSLGGEQSEIMSDGADGQVRTFTRPKGSASLAWEASDKLTLNATVEREVGQLNFFDFVSSVDLNAGNDQTGNVQIVPDQRWRFALEAERNYGTWGAVTAELFYDDIEDLIDQVPIGDNGEGPGNLDSASRFGFEFEGTLRFDNLGWDGAQLEYEGFLQDTFLDDPLTGDTRDFSWSTIHWYNLQFRYDLPNTDWAFGLNYESFIDAPNFRR